MRDAVRRERERQLEPELGAQLILQPAAGRGRWPDDSAVHLVHGRGLTRYEFDDGQSPEPFPWQGASKLNEHLADRVAQWVQAWQRLAEGLPRHYLPIHCREFDVQSDNREGLAICRALLPFLPKGQQLCFRGAKRKGVYHRSWLLEWVRKPETSAAPRLRDYNDRDPERWVRVMGDYGSTGIWEWSGSEMMPAELPITAPLKAQLADWARRFFSAVDSWRAGDADNFQRLCTDDVALYAYSDEGLSIARAIKAELPDWTVVYFDADLAGRHTSLARFQFEVM